MKNSRMSNRIVWVLCSAIVVATVMAARVASATEFTYQNVLLAYLKLSKDFDYQDSVDDWMKAFRPQVWNQAHDDEFLLDAKRKETLQMMKDSVARFNLAEPFVINTTVQFGDYEFDKQQFDLEPFSDATSFHVDHCCDSLPQQLQVSFANPTILNGLPMPKDQARMFLNGRNAGFVDRNVSLIIEFKITQVSGDNQMSAEIEQIQVRDPKSGNKLLYSVPASASPH
jgi:hypothetical protein